MVRHFIYAASGGAPLRRGGTAIRLALHGCANRPFYHIVIQNRWALRETQPIEQIGTFDPMANADNQKLVSVNLERLQYWIGQGSGMSRAIGKLFGIVGITPIHPSVYRTAYKNRQAATAAAAAAEAENKSKEESQAQAVA